MSRQPVWKTVYCTDYSKLEIDETGVYPPELTLVDDLGESDAELEGQFLVHRFPLEQCTFEDGILSDNKFHSESPAWFADKIEDVAQSSGVDATEMISFLCSDEPGKLAMAYENIASYFGAGNFDGYPRYVTEDEANEILS